MFGFARRQVALVVALALAVVAATSMLAAGSVTSGSAEMRFEQGHSIDWQLAALSVAPAADPLDSPSALALAAVGFRVDVPGAAPSALLFARPEQQTRCIALVRPSRARAPPPAWFVG